MTANVFADVYRPRAASRGLLYDAILVVGGSALLALMSQLVVYLPISPVPITGQTLAVLLLGATLGSRRGALAVLAYLGEAAMGLPILAGGMSGVAAMAGPTGGYLVGFIASAYIAGWFIEKGMGRHVITALMAMLAADLVIYVCGLAWLGVYVGYGQAIALGLAPFVIGDIMKILIAALVMPTAWRLVSRR
jgi:biotin transport system substrate-specific component